MSTITRVTYEQFWEMVDRGEFPEDRRVELIEGEVVVTEPPKPPHAAIIDILNEWSFESLRAVWVRIQNPLGLPELESVPLPDMAWVRRLDYTTDHPHASDVLLVVEVSGSSLRKDRERKARLYAAVGIADYWIVNIPGRRLEVFRDPVGLRYTTRIVLDATDEIRSLAFPEIVLDVGRLFPG